MESKTLKMIPFVVKDKKILSHISTYYNMAKDSNDPLFFISLPFHSHPCARGKNVQLHSLTLNSLSNKKQCSKSVITFSNNNINSTKSNKEGNNINDLIIASRFNNEFCNSYVFTARPIDLYEKIIIKVCGVNNSYVGSLAFGLTSCDPSKINPKGSLPDEANFLVDRSEYWVVMKDIISILKLGDEIAFYIDNKGQVNLEKNGFLIGNVIYVDITQSLWAFWDLYGSIQNIHILGSYRVTFDINQLNLQQNESVQFSFSAPSIINDLLINSETNSSSSLPLNRQINIKNRVKRNSYKQVDLEQPKIDSLIPNGIYDISPRFVYDLINKVPTTQLPDISDNLQANYIETKSHKIVNGLDINNHIDFNVEIPTSVCSRRPIKNDKKESTLETINGTLCEGVNNKDTLTPLLRREQECVVCYEPNVDCILYPCGHACMCYVCASQTWKMTLPSIHTSMPTYTTFNMPYNLPSLGLCPICRDSIKDVVKIYLP